MPSSCTNGSRAPEMSTPDVECNLSNDCACNSTSTPDPSTLSTVAEVVPVSDPYPPGTSLLLKTAAWDWGEKIARLRATTVAATLKQRAMGQRCDAAVVESVSENLIGVFLALWWRTNVFVESEIQSRLFAAW